MKMRATTSYTYDLADNRLSMKTTDAGEPSELYQYTYLPGTDRLASVSSGDAAFSRVYSHDTAGCITSIVSTGTSGFGLRTLTWNSLYQLTSVSTNGVVAESYTWDTLGRRATTTTAEWTVRHVYDGIHCIADLDEAGAVLRTYVWGPGIDNLLAVVVPSGGGASPPGEPCVYYALTDHQNTVHGFADINGAVVVRYTYDAWGNVLSEEYAVPALASNRYRFQGREYSVATGLTNFRARWYDPETGRWLSKDPIGLAGGLNLYVFGGNDVVNNVDPLGMNVFLVGPGEGSSVKYHQKILLQYTDEETCKTRFLAITFGLDVFDLKHFLGIVNPYYKNGVVTEDLPDGTRILEVALTHDQDMEVWNLFQSLINTEMHYNARSNCRTFSQYLLQTISEKYKSPINPVSPSSYPLDGPLQHSLEPARLHILLL